MKVKHEYQRVDFVFEVTCISYEKEMCLFTDLLTEDEVRGVFTSNPRVETILGPFA